MRPQNFGTSGVYGARLGYHITEDFFVEAVYGQTKVSDEAFRQILPGGMFASRRRKAQLLQPLGRLQLPARRGVHRHEPGQAVALYLIGGIGSTKFVDQRKPDLQLRLRLQACS